MENNKEQQIEEMMLDVPQTIVAYDANPKGQHLYGEQRLQIAEALYNAGYRRVDRFEAENEKLKMYNDKLCQGIYYGNGEQFSNTLEQEKEYAIKEFADKLKKRLTKFIWRHEIPECIFNDIMSELLKEYNDDKKNSSN